MFVTLSCFYHKFVKTQLSKLVFFFWTQCFGEFTIKFADSFDNWNKTPKYFSWFHLKFKKESTQGLDISSFPSSKICMKARTLNTCITKDSHPDYLPSSPCNCFLLCCLTVWDPFCQPSLPGRPNDTLQHPHVYLSWPQSASLRC